MVENLGMKLKKLPETKGAGRSAQRIGEVRW